MKLASPACWTILWTLCWLQPVAAQNLVIRNARLLDGDGGVVDNGTIVVRNGRIAAFAEGADSSDFPVLDVQGMTVIPAFTDAHRRVIRGDADEWMMQAAERMREYLDAGFTTVVTADEALEPILALRDRLESLEFLGPRLLVTGAVPLTDDSGAAIPEETIRNTVRELTFAGVDGITSIVHATPGGRERELLSIVRDESNEQGLVLITHIETVQDAVAAVAGDSGYLSRTPRVGTLDAASARDLVAAGRDNAEHGLVMTSTLDAALEADPGSPSLANARVLWDAGISYGYGTDTSFAPREALRRELDRLQHVFSNEEILTILTKNAALAARRDDALGVLSRGKFGDMLVLDGDPLADLENLFDIVLVIKAGRIVVDNR